MLGNLDRIVVPAGFGGSVAYKMFDASGDTVRVREPFTLVATHIGTRHDRAEVGIFTSAFGHSSPARVPRDIDHWGKDPADSRCGCFPGGHASRSLDKFRIPRGGQSERYRKLGSKPMDYVQTENKRDLQTGVLDCDPLISVRIPCRGDIEQ